MFWPFDHDDDGSIMRAFNTEFFIQCAVKLGPNMAQNGPYKEPCDSIAASVMLHLDLGFCCDDWALFSDMFSFQLAERSGVNQRAVQTVEQVTLLLCSFPTSSGESD